MHGREIAIIGGGIGGLAAAILLARDGNRVSLFEKNATLGGVCNRFAEQGFTFDTGPTWYMMPDVFRHFFQLLGEDVEDHLELVRLVPSHRVFFDTRPAPIDFFSDFERDRKSFELLEPGSAARVKEHFLCGEKRYHFAEEQMLHADRTSLVDYARFLIRTNAPNMGLFVSLEREVKKVARTAELEAVLHQPSAFLGSAPWRIPALFGFLSYLEFGPGVWYPMGGMYRIVEALVRLGERYKVKYYASSEVRAFSFRRGQVHELLLEDGRRFPADIIVSNADREFTERKLISSRRGILDSIFPRRPAYSALLLFLGVRRKVRELAHHNFFFARDWKKHLRDIDAGLLSDNPSFYVCRPSVTDPSSAPPGMENISVLIPVPASLSLWQDELDLCGERVLAKIISRAPSLGGAVIFEKRWYPADFAGRYNVFRGSALGLAQTFFQTGPFRPRHVSSRFTNLYFVGSTTNPGIGVPTCLLSAEQVWRKIRDVTSPGAAF